MIYPLVHDCQVNCVYLISGHDDQNSSSLELNQSWHYTEQIQPRKLEYIFVLKNKLKLWSEPVTLPLSDSEHDWKRDPGKRKEHSLLLYFWDPFLNLRRNLFNSSRRHSCRINDCHDNSHLINCYPSSPHQAHSPMVFPAHLVFEENLACHGVFPRRINSARLLAAHLGKTSWRGYHRVWSGYQWNNIPVFDCFLRAYNSECFCGRCGIGVLHWAPLLHK